MFFEKNPAIDAPVLSPDFLSYSYIKSITVERFGQQIIMVVNIGYNKIFHFIPHANIPEQSTTSPSTISRSP